MKQKYYGHSFITDHRGELVEKFGAEDEGVLIHTFDLDLIETYRAELGIFPRSPNRPLRQEHHLSG